MDPIFFAKLFGLYFLVVGVMVLWRKKSIMPALQELASNRALVLVIALVEIAAGLALVIARPDVTFNWQGLISLIGWMMVIEGLLYLALPAKAIRSLMSWFNKPAWFMSGGIISLLFGIYLTGIGFGLF